MSSIFSTPNPGVIVGIILNSTHMNRRVDRGPPATDEAACVSFKQFWGQKSEMRRFKDGSIIEAVVWSENDFPAESKTIRPSRLVTTIIQYILRRHLPFSAEIQMASDQIADLLPEVSQNLPVVNLPTANLQSYSTQGLYRRAIETVDVLRRLMSNLKGFPLAIESLRATSPALRYTSFFPPLFNPLISSAKYAMTWFSGERANPIAQVISLVADLEKSSRWPDELLALRSLKSALIVKLSACLEQQFAVLLDL
jgi:U3 small nucleolar RNA-associated protein 22